MPPPWRLGFRKRPIRKVLLRDLCHHHPKNQSRAVTVVEEVTGRNRTIPRCHRRDFHNNEMEAMAVTIIIIVCIGPSILIQIIFTDHPI